MVLFKTIDYYAQLILIVAALVASLFLAAANHSVFDVLTIGYFVVGGWQVCSVIANFMVPAQYKVKLRRIYLVLLGVTIFVSVVCLLQSSLIIGYLFILLFWAPVMAIIYVVACYREWKLVKLALESENTSNTNLAGQKMNDK